jgi:2-polyprenyl-3-methyl-5-hydroxy-6-metoxy-1,4-benzoquinol methylase/Zn ribbon nucleic-acid-binding protein
MNKYFDFIGSCPQCNSSDSSYRFSVDQLGFNIDIVECCNCGILYKQYFPNSNLMNLIYSDSYTHFSNNNKSSNSLSIHKSRINRLGKPNNKHNRHLDYGCGSGAFISAAMDSGWDSYGCDPFLLDESLKGQLKNRLFKIDTNDQNIKLTLGEFDVISLWAVTEHMPDIVHTFSSLQELLKPGGRIIFNWPYGNSYSAKYSGSKWSMSVLLEHLTFATHKSIKNLADQINMTVDEVIINGSPYPFGIVKNLSLGDQGIDNIDQLDIDIDKYSSKDEVGKHNNALRVEPVKYLLKYLRLFLLSKKSDGILANFSRYIIQLLGIGDHMQVVLVKSK